MHRASLPVIAKMGAITVYQDDETVPALEAIVQERLEKLTVVQHSCTFPQGLDPTTLANLRALSIENCRLDALKVARQLPQLTSLALRGMPGETLNTAELACAATLQSLTVTDSSIEQLAAFERYVSLSRVNMRFLRNRGDTRALANQPHPQEYRRSIRNTRI